MQNVAEKLDARGLNCPLPILRTRKALNQLNTGEVLEVTSSDPGSIKDMASFCEQTGHRLLASNEADSSYIFLIEKS